MESSTGVNTEVAVKVLRADIDPGSDSVKRLRDEGRLLGALSHPSILRVHDLAILEHRVSLVTEYVEGEDLDVLIAANIGLRALVMVVGEVASALAAAWSEPSPTTGAPLNLVHRDIKPANIRVGRHGEVKLLDFGIARATNVAREAQTEHDAMMGSYLYMAPERYHEDLVDAPSDIFALGAILFEGCAGRRFFAGMTLKQVYVFMLSARKFRMRLNDAIAELAIRDVPQPVLLLLQRMMHPDPLERPSASEVANICEDVAEELEGSALKRWCRDRVWEAPGEIHGSLTGKTLDAGTFLTAVPAQVRSRSARGNEETGGQRPESQQHARHVVPAPKNNPASLGIDIGQLPDFNEPALTFDRGDLADQPTEEVNRQVDYDAEFDRQLAERRSRKRLRQGLILALVALGFVGMVGVSLTLYLGSRTGAEAAPESPENAVTGAIEVEPPVEAEPDPGEADAEPAPEVVPAAEVASAPAPAPKSRPEVGLSVQGWGLVGSDPEGAKAKFKAALAVAPGHSDASYGLGYVLMNQDDLEGALPHLCRALASGESDIVTDVRGLLASTGSTCD